MLQHAIKIHTDKVAALKGQIEYCREALAAALEPWEAKEYAQGLKDAEVEKNNLEAHITHLQTLAVEG